MNDTLEEIVAIYEETATAIEQTSGITQEFNNSIEDVSKDTENLAELALKELVKHFKI